MQILQDYTKECKGEMEFHVTDVKRGPPNIYNNVKQINLIMKIEKVLETVFIKEWNTEAHILETDIVIRLFNNVFMNEKECFDYINEYCEGWVQTSRSFKECEKKGIPCGIKEDPLARYENLFSDLKKYAKSKYDT